MYELAQLNVAVMKAPLDSPPMADFVGNLDRIDSRANGPGPAAFTFAQAYGPPDSTSFATPYRIDGTCPA